jgi:hypothetical protein
MIAAEPLSLTCGGETATTPDMTPTASWIPTMRGSVPSGFPPAAVSIRVSCLLSLSAVCF